jgi:hypothetical protein
MERGESTVSAGGYLAALHVLGVLEHAAPWLRTDLWYMDTPLAYGHPSGIWTPLWYMDTPAGRARPEIEHDDDYF